MVGFINQYLILVQGSSNFISILSFWCCYSLSFNWLFPHLIVMGYQQCNVWFCFLGKHRGVKKSVGGVRGFTLELMDKPKDSFCLKRKTCNKMKSHSISQWTSCIIFDNVVKWEVYHICCNWIQGGSVLSECTEEGRIQLVLTINMQFYSSMQRNPHLHWSGMEKDMWIRLWLVVFKERQIRFEAWAELKDHAPSSRMDDLVFYRPSHCYTVISRC